MRFLATEAVTGIEHWLDDGEPEPEPLKPTVLDVNAERDRRLLDPFEFRGRLFDRDPVSVQRITGVCLTAALALMDGAQPTGPHWSGQPDLFTWIAYDNTPVPMDAQTVIAFGQAAAAVEDRLVKAARRLKDLPEIPEDFAEDRWWV